jgi:beta-aspartyl-peptidase (threonine type)
MNNTIAIAVHGGAKPFSATVEKNTSHYEEGLREAISSAYDILQRGGYALDAVEAAVRRLEDNIYFNAGIGSALNSAGMVEMDASIMDGSNLRAGAVAMVRKVRNPVSLARSVMTGTSHVFLGGEGALQYAERVGLELHPEPFFVTDEQFAAFQEHATKEASAKIKVHGTVGAVAADVHGNIASATSTGGTTFQMEGRIGDSCMVGSGCYANNKTCAVSTTGDGEYIIRGVIAYDISAAMEYSGKTLQDACNFVVCQKNKDVTGDIGAIAVDALGNIGISFNSECMLRAWKIGDGQIALKILR